MLASLYISCYIIFYFLNFFLLTTVSIAITVIETINNIALIIISSTLSAVFAFIFVFNPVCICQMLTNYVDCAFYYAFLILHNLLYIITDCHRQSARQRGAAAALRKRWGANLVRG